MADRARVTAHYCCLVGSEPVPSETVIQESAIPDPVIAVDGVWKVFGTALAFPEAPTFERMGPWRQ